MGPSIHLAAIHLANAVDALTYYKTSTYGLSFSPEFFGDPYSSTSTPHPTTVADAIAFMKSHDPDQWEDLAENLFGVPGELLGEDDVFEKVLETDTCGGLQPPVDVWIDPEGWYTLDIHDVYGPKDIHARRIR